MTRVKLGPCLLILPVACGAKDLDDALNFDTAPQCEGDTAACLGANTSSFESQGLRVIHKLVDGHPLVAMGVFFEPLPQNSLGLWSEDLALAQLDLGGPRRFTTASWQAELLDLGSFLRAGAASDYSYILAQAPAPNWDAMWDLLAEGVADPRNNDYDLDNRRGVVQRAYMAELDEPDSAASVDAFSRLFRGDAYNLRREALSALGAVGPGNINNAWQGLRAKNRMLVVVVGDVTRADVDAAVTRAFGALPAEGAVPGTPPAPSVPPPQPDVVVLPYPDSPTWHIRSYFKGPAPDSPDAMALNLGLAALSQRLFDEVRDARGLAYSAGANLDFSRRTYGRFWLTSEAPTQALPIVRQIAAELKASGPDERELAAVRRQIRTGMLADNDNPYSIAWNIGFWDQTFGDLYAAEAYLRGLDAVDAATVAAALDTYLRDVKTTAAGAGSDLVSADLSSLFVTP